MKTGTYNKILSAVPTHPAARSLSTEIARDAEVASGTARKYLGVMVERGEVDGSHRTRYARSAAEATDAGFKVGDRVAHVADDAVTEYGEVVSTDPLVVRGGDYEEEAEVENPENLRLLHRRERVEDDAIPEGWWIERHENPTRIEFLVFEEGGPTWESGEPRDAIAAEVWKPREKYGELVTEVSWPSTSDKRVVLAQAFAVALRLASECAATLDAEAAR